MGSCSLAWSSPDSREQMSALAELLLRHGLIGIYLFEHILIYLF